MRKLIDQKRDLPVSQILEIAIDTAYGLQAIHDQGLVHQDVTPNNILIDEATGIAKLNDFGLARAQTLVLTSGGPTSIAGTVFYISPELVFGGRPTARSDIWSWGAIVLEMLAGRTWLSGPAVGDAFDYHCQQTSKNGRPLPPALVKVLKRCFQVSPENRWPWLDEVIAALQDTQE